MHKVHRRLPKRIIKGVRAKLQPVSGVTMAMAFEREKDKIRQRILRAAAAQFQEKGYKDTTWKDIATAANVALRTVHNQVGSKPEIYFQDRTLIETIIQVVSDAPSGETVEAIADVMFDINPGHREFEHRDLEYYGAWLWQQLEENLVGALRAKSTPGTPALTLRVEASLLVAMVRSLYWEQYEDTHGRSDEAQERWIRQISAVVHTALRELKTGIVDD